MRKQLLSLLFILFFQLVHAQVPSSFYLDVDDEYAFCRFTQDYIYFYTGGKLIKTDYQGNVLWTRSTLFIPQVIVDENLYGIVYSGNNHLELVKADSSGNILWAKDVSQTVCPQYPGDFNAINGVTVNGNRIYLSSSQWNSFTGSDGWAAMMMMDTSGTLLNSWCDPYSWMSVNYLMGRGFQSITGGGWYIIEHPGVGYEESVVKVNSNGEFDLTHQAVFFDMGNSVHTNDILTLPDSNYLALCNTSPDGTWPLNGYHIGLSKFDESGNIFWQKLIWPISDTAFSAYAATADENGNIYIDGDYGTDMWIGKFFIKLDSQGNLLSANHWTDSLMTENFKLDKLFYKNGYVCSYINYFDGIKHVPGMMVFDTVSMAACGISQSPISINIVDDTQYHQSWQQFPTVGYSAPNDTLSSAAVAGLPVNDLCMLLVSSGNIEIIQPEVFPNPFQNSITIEEINGDKNSVKVFDLKGELVFEKQIQGKSKLDLSFLSPGIYQLSIQSNTNIFTKKIVKM